MKKQIIAFVTAMVTIILCGCNGIGQSKSNTNVYVYNCYNGDNQVYSWSGSSLASPIKDEYVGYRYNDSCYIKVDNCLYKLSKGKKELIYENDQYIWSIISAGENYVVFADFVDDNSNGEKCRLQVYYTNTETIETIVEEETEIICFSYCDIEDIVLKNNDDDDSFVFVTNLAYSPTIVESKTKNDLPEGYYYIDVSESDNSEDYIVFTYNDMGEKVMLELNSWYEISSGLVNIAKAYPKHKDCKAGHKAMVKDDCVLFHHLEYNGAGIDKVFVADESHCSSYYWIRDAIEKYNYSTEITTEIYSDRVNRILGYNYDENVVYLYSNIKNEIEAKDLDDNSVTTLSSLEKAQTIKFTWCDKTLFWIYENDGIESYGGYLDL